jgi:hypothetical protein
MYLSNGACLACPLASSCAGGQDAPVLCDAVSVPSANAAKCQGTSEISVPYVLSSPSMCRGASAVALVLDPSSGIAAGMRTSFAGPLGLPPSATFIQSVTSCDSTVTLVDRDAPVNVALNISTKGRRLQSTSSLTLNLDGNSIIIDLGLSIPTAVADVMTRFVMAVLNGTSPSEIAAAGAALSVALTAADVGVPPAMAAMLNTVSVGGTAAAANLSAAMNSAPLESGQTLLVALGANDTTLTVRAAASAIFAAPAVLRRYPPVSLSLGTAALGALVLLLLLLPAYLYYRRVAAQRSGAAQAKAPKGVFSTVVTEAADAEVFSGVNPMGRPGLTRMSFSPPVAVAATTGARAEDRHHERAAFEAIPTQP